MMYDVRCLNLEFGDFWIEKSIVQASIDFLFKFSVSFQVFFLFLQVKKINTNQECRNLFFRP